MFRPKDFALLKQRGISPETAQQQLDRFATGFPYLQIKSPATPGHGITILDEHARESAEKRWSEYLADGGEVFKFVPASGAASRMFKALFEYIDGESDTLPPGSPITVLMENLENLPFINDLRQATIKMYGENLDAMKAAGRNRDIIAAIVKPEGMNYGQLPKALLKFHTYDGSESRTALEEQLTEGSQTAANNSGEVKLHFTISGNHRKLFEQKLDETIPAAEKRTGKKFIVSLSEQKASTDTLAANPDNTPFLENDNLFFRPGGHGALIQNLNDIDSTVVFIKNIDNVVPDSRRDDTVIYKRMIGGYLLQLHDRIAGYISAIDNHTADNNEIIAFMRRELSTDDSRFDTLDGDNLSNLLRKKLNRPLRVCGMVCNEGEPGGGPYLAVNPDGSVSPQVLESTQIDMRRDDYKAMVSQATHFNPVDLVCYIKDTEGRKYNLPDYVDHATGFISSKSSHGRELRAMELPGLWNGAMSDWNTAFVEVPLSTFNPVKTVNDLLRPMHRQS